MTVSTPYINSLNFSWIIKCPFLRNMEPLGGNKVQYNLSTQQLVVWRKNQSGGKKKFKEKVMQTV